MSPCRVDWTDKKNVITYARSLGPGMTVYKHPDRISYSIRHTSNYTGPKEWVVVVT